MIKRKRETEHCDAQEQVGSSVSFKIENLLSSSSINSSWGCSSCLVKHREREIWSILELINMPKKPHNYAYFGFLHKFI